MPAPPSGILGRGVGRAAGWQGLRGALGESKRGEGSAHPFQRGSLRSACRCPCAPVAGCVTGQARAKGSPYTPPMCTPRMCATTALTLCRFVCGRVVVVVMVVVVMVVVVVVRCVAWREGASESALHHCRRRTPTAPSLDYETLAGVGMGVAEGEVGLHGASDWGQRGEGRPAVGSRRVRCGRDASRIPALRHRR